jgi:hypothetical protein
MTPQTVLSLDVSSGKESELYPAEWKAREAAYLASQQAKAKPTTKPAAVTNKKAVAKWRKKRKTAGDKRVEGYVPAPIRKVMRAEAKKRECSLGDLVREALDVRFGGGVDAI